MTTPMLTQKMQYLLQQIQSLSEDELQTLLAVSPKLNVENHLRYANWDTTDNSPALESYNGDAFASLKSVPLTTDNWQHANKHIVLLSGLYGILRATDSIKPHRLEMATKTRQLIGVSLYDYWRKNVTKTLNNFIAEANALYLLQLASKEYFSVIAAEEVSVPIIRVAFKTSGERGLRTIAFHAKKARGRMARFVLDRQIRHPEALHTFVYDGYTYAPELSEDSALVFLRQ